MTMIDVGQGDAALIEFPHGKTILVDGGSGGAFDVGRIAVAPYLWERRIRTIDYLVGTHPQMDHIGGFSSLIRSFQVGEVWTNGESRDLPFYRLFSDAMEQKGLRPKVITGDAPPMSIDGCFLHFLNPPAENLFAEGDLNDRSIVLRLACPDLGDGGLSFLFTGDIEQGAEEHLLQQGIDLKSTFLKVPHHGSRSALNPAFLSTVSPQVALFSVGRHNSYHHPHLDVLDAYQALSAQIYRTDRDGAIVIEADRAGWEIRTYQECKMTKVLWRAPLLMQEWENLRRAFRRF